MTQFHRVNPLPASLGFVRNSIAISRSGKWCAMPKKAYFHILWPNFP